jgi:maltose O-acetyltransferase
MAASAGIRPLTEAELQDRGPNPVLASAYHAAEVVRWLVRVSPATSALLPVSLRRRLLRLAGLSVGRQVTGLKKCSFESRQVTLGDGSFINTGCCFEGRGSIDIGRDAFIGPQTMILTSTHDIDQDGEVARMPGYEPVHIGARCWLGARVTVLPGVKIGAGTVIAAGAVVNKDCEPGAVYAGVPARRVR